MDILGVGVLFFHAYLLISIKHVILWHLWPTWSAYPQHFQLSDWCCFCGTGFKDDYIFLYSLYFISSPPSDKAFFFKVAVDSSLLYFSFVLPIVPTVFVAIRLSLFSLMWYRFFKWSLVLGCVETLISRKRRNVTIWEFFCFPAIYIHSFESFPYRFDYLFNDKVSTYSLQ